MKTKDKYLNEAKDYKADPKLVKELEQMAKRLRQVEKKLDSPDMLRDIQGAYDELESLIFRMKRGN